MVHGDESAHRVQQTLPEYQPLMRRANKTMGFALLALLATVCHPIAAQDQAGETLVLANDKLAMAVATRGARIAQVSLKSDGTNPLAAMGHFLALDGFGAGSQ